MRAVHRVLRLLTWRASVPELPPLVVPSFAASLEAERPELFHFGLGLAKAESLRASLSWFADPFPCGGIWPRCAGADEYWQGPGAPSTRLPNRVWGAVSQRLRPPPCSWPK